MDDLFVSSLSNLEKFIQDESYCGYDPYDILNSPIPFHKFGKWAPVISTQIHKRNPINLRPLLGIKKEINPKAYGLFLSTCSKLFELSQDEEYLKTSSTFFHWLSANRSKGFENACWGYNFPWTSPLKSVPAHYPSVVATAFVVKGLYQYYELMKDDQIKGLILSAADYVLKDLPKFENDHGVCISYTDIQLDVCYNANLLAAEILSYAYILTNDEKLRAVIKRVLGFTVHYQHDDGHWNYSLDPKTGKEREQIDFHQGYILESFEIICQNCGFGTTYDDSIKKGMKYYRERQFLDNGKSFWRLPRKWPVEIHNQSQGIITFLKLKRFDSDYESFAHKIASWTIQNMQDETGYFYYQKHRFYTIKIPYMRWSQAWMYLALTDLLFYEDK